MAALLDARVAAVLATPAPPRPETLIAEARAVAAAVAATSGTIGTTSGAGTHGDAKKPAFGAGSRSGGERDAAPSLTRTSNAASGPRGSNVKLASLAVNAVTGMSGNNDGASNTKTNAMTPSVAAPLIPSASVGAAVNLSAPTFASLTQAFGVATRPRAAARALAVDAESTVAVLESLAAQLKAGLPPPNTVMLPAARNMLATRSGIRPATVASLAATLTLEGSAPRDRADALHRKPDSLTIGHDPQSAAPRRSSANAVDPSTPSACATAEQASTVAAAAPMLVSAAIGAATRTKSAHARRRIAAALASSLAGTDADAALAAAAGADAELRAMLRVHRARVLTAGLDAQRNQEQARRELLSKHASQAGRNADKDLCNSSSASSAAGHPTEWGFDVDPSFAADSDNSAAMLAQPVSGGSHSHNNCIGGLSAESDMHAADGNGSSARSASALTHGDRLLLRVVMQRRPGELLPPPRQLLKADALEDVVARRRAAAAAHSAHVDAVVSRCHENRQEQNRLLRERTERAERLASSRKQVRVAQAAWLKVLAAAFSVVAVQSTVLAEKSARMLELAKTRAAQRICIWFWSVYHLHKLRRVGRALHVVSAFLLRCVRRKRVVKRLAATKAVREFLHEAAGVGRRARALLQYRAYMRSVQRIRRVLTKRAEATRAQRVVLNKLWAVCEREWLVSVSRGLDDIERRGIAAATATGGAPAHTALRIMGYLNVLRARERQLAGRLLPSAPAAHAGSGRAGERAKEKPRAAGARLGDAGPRDTDAHHYEGAEMLLSHTLFDIAAQSGERGSTSPLAANDMPGSSSARGAPASPLKPERRGSLHTLNIAAGLGRVPDYVRDEAVTRLLQYRKAERTDVLRQYHRKMAALAPFYKHQRKQLEVVQRLQYRGPPGLFRFDDAPLKRMLPAPPPPFKLLPRHSEMLAYVARVIVDHLAFSARVAQAALDTEASQAAAVKHSHAAAVAAATGTSSNSHGRDSAPGHARATNDPATSAAAPSNVRPGARVGVAPVRGNGRVSADVAGSSRIRAHTPARARK